MRLVLLSSLHDRIRLMLAAFDFTDEDLLANRAGKLSPRQHEQVEEYLRLAKKRSQFALIAGTGSATVLFGVAFLVQSNQFLQALPFLGIGVALYLLIFLSFMVVDFNKLRRLNAREVQSVAGIAHRTTKKLRHGRWTAYYVTVEKIRFQIHHDQYDAFQNGGRVRVFFIHYPPTHWVLSVEQN